MNFKRKITLLVSILLLGASIFGIVATAAVSGSYDSSVIGSEGNTEISTTEILERYLGESISTDEKEFFDTLSELGVLETVKIAYNEIINTDKADVEYRENKLYVTAGEYEYKGVNNKSFVWIPESVEIDTENEPLVKNGDAYTCVIDCSEPVSDDEIKIVYVAEVEIAKEDINEILNLYRNTAEYVVDRSNYEAYLIEKKMYDDAYAKYTQYLADVEEYNQLLEDYKYYNEVAMPKYLEDLKSYEKYEVEKKEYDEKLAKYNAYLKEYSKIEKQLNAVKLIDVMMPVNSSVYGVSLERNIYDSVMGGTVDIVLQRQGDIVAGGAKPEMVELAGDATVRVRQLMVEFKACKTDREKYIYYTNNYENFCNSFLDLTKALDVLYRSRVVRAAIIAQGKNPQYVLLVCQLALVTAAMIDGEVRDYNGNVAYNSSWTIDGCTIDQVLGHITYFVDDDTGAPMDVPAEVPKPADLAPAEKPTLPKTVTEPIAPAEVTEPEKIDAVPNPDASLKQDCLSKIYGALSQEYKSSLKDAFVGGTIPSSRTLATADVKMPVRTVLNKTYNSEKINVTFKYSSKDGLTEKTSTVTVDKNTPVTCEFSIPVSETDNNGDSWVLIGWKNENSEKLEVEDLKKGFDSDVVLVPLYDHIYNITWEIEGATYTKYVSAHEKAVCPVIPTKADVENKYYKFAGWIDEDGNNVGEEIGKPTSDGKYVASFDEKYVVSYTDKSGAQIEYTDDNVICDATGFGSSSAFDISVLVDRVFERHAGLTFKTVKGTLKFTFSDVLLLKEAGAQTLKVENSGNKSIAKFKIEIRDNSGELVETSVNYEALCRVNNPVDEHYRLFGKHSDGERIIGHKITGQNISFNAEVGVEYEFRTRYNIMLNVINIGDNPDLTDPVDFVISSSNPKENEDVRYQIIAKPGVEICSITVQSYYYDAESETTVYNPVTVKTYGSMADGEFRVYSKDVEITVAVRYKSYTVTFIANGKNIYQQSVEYGSMPTPPADPKLSNDEMYSYKFLGWDKEISPVTCDVVYEAVYEKTLLPPKEELDLSLSSEVKSLIKLAAIAFVVFAAFVTVLTTLVVKIVGKIKSRRKGYVTYREYKADKLLLKRETKYAKLSEKLKFDAKNPVRSMKKLEKAGKKLSKAESVVEKAVDRRVKKELKKLS